MSADLEWVERPDCSGGHPYADHDKHEWRAASTIERVPYRTCSFCGSMHPQDLLAVLADERSRCLTSAEHVAILRAGPITEAQSRMPAITLEWADFKYGYPHKLYVRHNDGSGAWGKFYAKHLFELPDATFDVVSAAIAERTFVLFMRDEIGTKWRLLPRDADAAN